MLIIGFILMVLQMAMDIAACAMQGFWACGLRRRVLFPALVMKGKEYKICCKQFAAVVGPEGN